MWLGDLVIHRFTSHTLRRADNAASISAFGQLSVFSNLPSTHQTVKPHPSLSKGNVTPGRFQLPELETSFSFIWDADWGRIVKKLKGVSGLIVPDHSCLESFLIKTCYILLLLLCCSHLYNVNQLCLSVFISFFVVINSLNSLWDLKRQWTLHIKTAELKKAAPKKKNKKKKRNVPGNKILRLEVQVYRLWDTMEAMEDSDDSQTHKNGTHNESGTHRCELVFECHIA